MGNIALAIVIVVSQSFGSTGLDFCLVYLRQV